MIRPCQLHTDRRGATLVEVLMALLIMAVGVTSVFTLFPLSIVRSIKSNQLTNAKLVEENARQIILANPQLVTGAPPWRPNSVRPLSAPYLPTGPGAKVSSAWVTPTARPGRALPETNLLFFAVPGGSLLTSNDLVSGTTSTFEPKWPSRTVNWTGAQVPSNRGGYYNHQSGYLTIPPFPNPISDGSLNWFSYRHSRYESDPRWSMYVVDPVGWYGMDPSGANYRDRFGQLDRIHCQLSLDQANELFSSLDTWSTIQEPIVPVSMNTGAPIPYVEFETQIDLSQSRKPPIGNQPKNRLVFLSEDGRRTFSLPIDTSAGAQALPANQVAWSGTLPADFDTLGSTETATVRVDAYEQRYSWMMTVLMSPKGEAKIDCVVFHNRSFNPLDEEAVAAEFGPDINNRNQATLTWPAARSGGDLPMKEGGFVFDAVNGHWYRVQKVVSYDNTVDPRLAVVDLNTNVTVSSTAAIDYDGAAIVLPNIVTIFHLDME